jgi:hypothetical protein
MNFTPKLDTNVVLQNMEHLYLIDKNLKADLIY